MSYDFNIIYTIYSINDYIYCHILILSIMCTILHITYFLWKGSYWLVATHFTVYRLKDSVNWRELIEEFNDGKNTDKQFVLKENKNVKLKNISKFSLYKRAAENTPDWS